MKNKGGFTKIVTEIIVLGIVAVIGVLYFTIFKSPETSAPTQNRGATPATDTSSTALTGWQTYTNNQYGFEVSYPSGTEIRDVDATGGRSITFNFSQRTPGFDFTFPTVIITVQTEEYYNSSQLTPVTECHPGDNPSTSTVNGIDFLESDTSNMHGGTESAANAESYCVVKGGTRYTLEAIDMYSRCAAYSGKGGSCIQEAQAPDKTLDFQKFDQTIQALRFRFINSASSQSNAQNQTSTASTYSSKYLGVSFNYDPTIISPDEEGDTIYINFANDTVPSGDYIEIFNKDPTDSFVEGIRKNILANYPSSYCQVNTEINGYKNLNSLGWDVGELWYTGPDQEYPWPQTDVCNNKYLNVSSPGIFLYNPAYPSKFLFWRGGAELNPDQIFATLQFTSSTPNSTTTRPANCPEYVNCMPGPDVNQTCIIPPGCENFTQKAY